MKFTCYDKNALEPSEQKWSSEIRQLEVKEKLSKKTVRNYFKKIIEKNEEDKDKPFVSKEEQEQDRDHMLFGR